MIKKLTLLVLLILISLGGSGCWDMMDIEKNAFILTLGFDTPKSHVNPLEINNPEFAPPPKIHLTMEVFSPYLAKQTGERNTIVIHQDAPTPLEAIKLAQSQIPRRLSQVHLRAVVIGEELASQGIENIIDTMKRNPWIADRFRLIFVHDYRAEDILEAQVKTEANVADVISKLGEQDTAYAFHRTVDFNDLYEELKVNKGTAYAPHYDLNEQGLLSKIGGAVIKNWRFLDNIDGYDVHGVNWITGNVKQSSVTTPLDDMLATYLVMSATRKIIPAFNQGQPGFQMIIRTEGTLTCLENEPPQGIEKKLLERLEEALAQRIKKEAQDALALSQKKYQADYLGFGQNFYNKFPRIYQDLDWEALYPNIPIEVQVQAKITRIGAER